MKYQIYGKLSFFVASLLCSVAIIPAHAAEVSSWAELNAAAADDIVLTGDIQAEGSPSTIDLTAPSSQTLDGGNFSLTGASGYMIKKTAGTNLTIQNFGEVIDGTENDYTYSYTDSDENPVYKKITGAVTGFSGVPFSPGSTNVSINNTVFKDNTDQVLSLSSGSTLSNVVFYGNKTTVEDHAILTFSSGATSTVNNLVFDSNEAKNGGILIDFYIGTTTTLNSAIIQNNKGGWYGSLQLSGGLVNINDSQFINNKSSCDGGAITVTSKMQDITNSLFKDNRSGWSGGAIWYMQLASSPHIVNTVFDGNHSGTIGGALYMGGTSASTGSVYLINSELKNNQGSYGGGIYSDGVEGFFVVDTDLTGNTAIEGGGIYSGNANLNIFANTKDVQFTDNVASNTTDTYNGGSAVYFEDSDDDTEVEMNVNAASGRKVIFNDTIASYGDNVILNVNKSGLTYEDISGESIAITNSGEIQFNNTVGDESGNIFNINLYAGKLSIGQASTVTNPDGLINCNNFTVAGASTLNTANGVIGEFAPSTFVINSDLQYEFDLDLAQGKSDKLTGATNNGSLTLSTLNVISDTEAENLKVVYSDTNINGVLKDDYTITTSTATYDVTAGNDETGSYLLFTRGEDLGGLPAAIKSGADAYSITDGADEVVVAWGTNDLKADLTVNGNSHAITTENDLDGINVGSAYTLTMNDVSDMRGFNYAISNEGTTVLTNSTISDAIINDGTLEINEGVSLGAVSGAGVINVNADHTLNSSISGNTVNIKNATVSGVEQLATDTNLNVIGGTVNLANQTANLKSAVFDTNSTLAISVNSVTDYGHLTAENITIAEGAKLQATLAQGIVKSGESATLQLLSANNTEFNNFTDSFDNNMYHFEKADNNGKYTITSTSSAEDVVIEAGGQAWVAGAAKAYVDSNTFETGSISAEIANKLADLAQNNVAALIAEIKNLAPTEAAVLQDRAISDASRLFRTVDNHLQGVADPAGISAGDMLSDVSIWAKPYTGKTKIGKRGNVAGQKSTNIGIIAGIEKKIEPEIKVGVGLHYDNMDVEILNRDADVDTIAGFMYMKYQPDDWFINTIGSYAKSDYNEHKFALGSKYDARYDVHTASAAIMSGYQFKYFTPEIGIHYYHINRTGYTDTAAQYVHELNTNYLRATGGVHLAENYGIFRPELYLGLSYDLVSPVDKTTVSLTNGTNYVVDGEQLPRLGYELSVGLNTFLMDNMTLGINYSGAYRRKYQDHAGMIKFKYDF